MEMIVEGRILDLIMLIIMIMAVYYYIKRAVAGMSLPEIRSIPAVDAIEEGVRRAIEMGRPVHFASGFSGGRLSGYYAAMSLASIECLRYVAGLCAEHDASLIVSCPGIPEYLPLLEATVADAYKEAGKPEKFSRDMIRFYGRHFTAYCQGVTGVLRREKVATNICIGAWHTDCVPILEGAKIGGAMNIGGTARWIMMYAFAMMADYTLIAEEIYAAGAKVSKDPIMLSGVAAEEVGKYICFILLIIGLILITLRLPFGKFLEM